RRVEAVGLDKAQRVVILGEAQLLIVQELAQGLADQGMIIGNQDFHRDHNLYVFLALLTLYHGISR
ncbi:MAG TPA: hypothetical protein VGP50_09250, partial [Stellaceae bacterium]|nr:hypothetical protein [Stellaceae bacterium]